MEKKRNRFKKKGFLGHGAYGHVIKVQNSENEELVLKIISLAGMDDEAIRATYQEVEIMRKLRHPNIITFKDVWKSNDNGKSLNILMEYADDGTLEDKLLEKVRENKGEDLQYFSEHQILYWFAQICLAVKEMHDKNFLHRDIKLDNILLKKNGLVKIADFGFSTMLHHTQA